jgi:hypothetical protein
MVLESEMRHRKRSIDLKSSKNSERYFLDIERSLSVSRTVQWHALETLFGEAPARLLPASRPASANVGDGGQKLISQKTSRSYTVSVDFVSREHPFAPRVASRLPPIRLPDHGRPREFPQRPDVPFHHTAHAISSAVYPARAELSRPDENPPHGRWVAASARTHR